MRKWMMVSALVAVAACSSKAPSEDGVSALPSTSGLSGYQIITPVITVNPGEEKTLCYFTTIQAPADFGVTKFSSVIPPGSHHMTVFTTPDHSEPDGTFVDCADSASTTALPVYGAQIPNEELTMPQGVGISLGKNQPIVVQLHYVNPGQTTLSGRATINVETFPDGATYTHAASYAAYSTKINVPPKGKQDVQGSCDTPVGATFFNMTTHSHRFTTHAEVADGTHALVDTTDWAHATVTKFDAPYYKFTSTKVTFGCQYSNPTDAPVVFGPSAETDEMCVAIGYFFPATGPIVCIDGLSYP